VVIGNESTGKSSLFEVKSGVPRSSSLCSRASSNWGMHSQKGCWVTAHRFNETALPCRDVFDDSPTIQPRTRADRYSFGNYGRIVGIKSGIENFSSIVSSGLNFYGQFVMGNLVTQINDKDKRQPHLEEKKNFSQHMKIQHQP
jgi:hypothetical protein